MLKPHGCLSQKNEHLKPQTRFAVKPSCNFDTPKREQHFASVQYISAENENNNIYIFIQFEGRWIGDVETILVFVFLNNLALPRENVQSAGYSRNTGVYSYFDPHLIDPRARSQVGTLSFAFIHDYGQ